MPPYDRPFRQLSLHIPASNRLLDNPVHTEPATPVSPLPMAPTAPAPMGFIPGLVPNTPGLSTTLTGNILVQNGPPGDLTQTISVPGAPSVSTLRQPTPADYAVLPGFSWPQTPLPPEHPQFGSNIDPLTKPNTPLNWSDEQFNKIRVEGVAADYYFRFAANVPKPDASMPGTPKDAPFAADMLAHYLGLTEPPSVSPLKDMDHFDLSKPNDLTLKDWELKLVEDQPVIQEMNHMRLYGGDVRVDPNTNQTVHVKGAIEEAEDRARADPSLYGKPQPIASLLSEDPSNYFHTNEHPDNNMWSFRKTGDFDIDNALGNFDSVPTGYITVGPHDFMANYQDRIHSYYFFHGDNKLGNEGVFQDMARLEAEGGARSFNIDGTTPTMELETGRYAAGGEVQSLAMPLVATSPQWIGEMFNSLRPDPVTGAPATFPRPGVRLFGKSHSIDKSIRLKISRPRRRAQTTSDEDRRAMAYIAHIR